MPPFPAALRALLAGAIDYAGLFPPAALPLEPTLRNYRGYLDSPESWMLGSFVLPVGQFTASEEWLGQFDERHPLRISALGAKTNTASDFVAEVGKVADGLRSMRKKHAPRILVTQLEIALPPAADGALLRALIAGLARPGFDHLPVFCEAASAAEVPAVIELLGGQRLEAGARLLGFKLRTGGVTASAFPNLAEVASALAAAAAAGVPIKFTAGLHHPIRAHHDSVQTKMHGFLNMLLAALLARRGGREAELIEVLAEESPAAFELGGEQVRCGAHSLDLAEIARHRPTVVSFGSCSFDEPREDLAGLLKV